MPRTKYHSINKPNQSKWPPNFKQNIHTHKKKKNTLNSNSHRIASQPFQNSIQMHITWILNSKLQESRENTYLTLIMERISVLKPTRDGKLPKCCKSLRNKAKSRGLRVKRWGKWVGWGDFGSEWGRIGVRLWVLRLKWLEFLKRGFYMQFLAEARGVSL